MVAVHSGLLLVYWLALSGTPELVDQSLRADILPVMYTFSPYVVVSVRSNVTGMLFELQPPGVVVDGEPGRVEVGVT